MNSGAVITPDTLLEALLAKGGRSQRLDNLRKINELCRQQYAAGARDFTLPYIGRLVEDRGIMKGRALYNAPSADYRALIEAWANYAGPPAPKPPKPLASNEYLNRIQDSALRSYMQLVIVERDKLKAQLNLLKGQSSITIDRRPTVVDAAMEAHVSPAAIVYSLTTLLTDSEREALQKAADSDYLTSMGLQEGSHGEILNDRGRVIFEVGFTRAIKKILGNSPAK